MRRGIKSQKNKKTEVHSDADEEINDSVNAENDETESESGVESTVSPTKKRMVRQAKTSKEDESTEGKNETSTRRRKKDDSIDNESNGESDKPVNKKKRGKVDKESKSQGENGKVEENGKSTPKNRKKAVKKEEEEEYEVEKIIDQRTIKGRRQFLIRWKGYSAESDTWQHEKELNCSKLIEEFLAEQEEIEKSAEIEIKNDKNKNSNKKSSKGKKDLKTNNAKDDQEDEDSGDSSEYEVEKIIKIGYKMDGTRLYLLRWKGFPAGYDSWEPEECLNCSELINDYIEKSNKIKRQDSRELRINPSPTHRYTLTMHADKRQSRRNANKERKRYYECD